MIEKNNISMSVIRRLPRYYRYLRELEKAGVSHISSKELSEKMGFTASQIRQDFNCFGGFGQQGYGYSVSNLRNTIGNILKTSNAKKCILIGVGNLGRALLSIDFKRMGFELSAVFDSNKNLSGKTIRGYDVKDIETLEEYCRNNSPVMAIICIPTSHVEEISEKLCDYGIKAFWNFSHFDIGMKHPDITVENVHLNDSLMTLSYLINK